VYADNFRKFYITTCKKSGTNETDCFIFIIKLALMTECNIVANRPVFVIQVIIRVYPSPSESGAPGGDRRRREIPGRAASGCRTFAGVVRVLRGAFDQLTSGQMTAAPYRCSGGPGPCCPGCPGGCGRETRTGPPDSGPTRAHQTCPAG
jgi:hypothetical protein